MARSLAQILQEANSIIEKRASEVSATAEPVVADDVEKLAQEVLWAPPAVEAPVEMTDLEKLAYSAAVLETLLSHEEFNKLRNFEKSAKEKGFSDDEITEAFSKIASSNEKMAAAGQRVLHFMQGAGDALQNLVDNVPVLKGSVSHKAGQVAGFAAPVLGIAGLGAMGGAHLKEEQIKRQMGIA